MGLLNMLNLTDINSGVEEFMSTSNAVLLDVREPSEYSEGHISGSINLSLQKIDRVGEVVSDKTTPLFVHCYSGARSGQAVSALKKMGYTNVKNIGGIGSYRGKITKGN